MGGDASPIDAIEAAYGLDGDDRSWLDMIVSSVAPLIDRGNGIIAYTFALDRKSRPQFANLTFRGTSRDMAETCMEIAKAGVSNGVSTPMHVDPEALGTMVETAKRQGVADRIASSPMGAEFVRLKIADVIALRTIEPGGFGVCICGASHNPLRLTRGQKRVWTRVAAHVAAGRRLRAAAAQPEAVLTPSGQVVHADGECKPKQAREWLRDAVVRQEHARGRARRSEPERAVEAWTALVSGRWSLVDRFERGGRRFVVARRNELGIADPRALSERERAVAHLAALGKANKLIAYELGIAETTAATHLASAMRKLGAKARADLARLLAGLRT